MKGKTLTLSRSVQERNSFPFFSSDSSRPFFTPAIQPKLEIGRSNDEFEQQSYRIADAVVQRKYTGGEQEEKLQKKKTGNTPQNIQAPDYLIQQIQSGSGLGSRLPDRIQSEMSQKIGADFSGVNIYTDAKSTQMSDALGARAFTHGNNIYFNKGEFNPETTRGKHLLGHELTHVVQQTSHETQANRVQKQDDNSVPTPDAEEDSFDFDFEVLPPALQFTIGNWMLEANTGSSELQFTQGLFGYTFGYSYGRDIFAGINSPGFSSRLGVNPGTGAMSLGFTHDQFRFGGSFNPADSSVGLNVGYGASLLPMPSALQESVYGGWGGVTSIYGDLGSMQNPISFYQAHSDDVDAIMGAVRALQPLAGEGSARFGAGLRFTYNPETGALISGGMQWFF